MIFQDYYEEILKKYQDAGKALIETSETLSSINCFGDLGDIHRYESAKIKCHILERQFHDLLFYVKEGGIKPDSEFIQKQYMYDFIKLDQKKRGVIWDEVNGVPSGMYSTNIGLTNEGVGEKLFQGVEYTFPVISLEHGKECYDFLIKVFNTDDEFDVYKLDFSNVLDANRPLYIRVRMTAHR